MADVVLFREIDHINNWFCREQEEWIDDFDLDRLRVRQIPYAKNEKVGEILAFRVGLPLIADST